MRIPILLVTLLMATPASAQTTLRGMICNIRGGGGNAAKGIEKTVAVLQAATRDIVGIQETMLEGETCTADNSPPQGTSMAKAWAAAMG